MPANVTASTAPTETIPSDGDARNATSVNPALQKLLDYIANISNTLGVAGGVIGSKVGPSILTWGAASIPANTSLNFFRPGWTTVALDTTEIFLSIPFAAKLSQLRVTLTTPATVGAALTITVRIGGVNTAINVVIPAGSTTTALDGVNTATISAGQTISIGAQFAAGVTTGASNVVATLLYTLA